MIRVGVVSICQNLLSAPASTGNRSTRPITESGPGPDLLSIYIFCGSYCISIVEAGTWCGAASWLPWGGLAVSSSNARDPSWRVSQEYVGGAGRRDGRTSDALREPLVRVDGKRPAWLAEQPG